MSLLRVLAVRHGQASFHADNYDELSAAGHDQALALGRWLASHDETFERVLCGRLRRQAQTLAGIAAAYAEAGRALPETEISADLDEFDHRAVVAAFVAREPRHPLVVAADQGRSRDLRAVFALLRGALLSWSRGELDAAGEHWDSFKQRTRRPLQQLRDSASGTVLLVSSGGVIAQLAAAALEVPDHRAVELNLSLRNSALCELLAGSQGLHLSCWNALPHLADRRSLWTHV